MKSFFKFIGSVLYGVVMSYLMWLLFYWLTPIIMSLSWGWAIIYFLIAGGAVTAFVCSITSFVALPWVLLGAKCKPARYAPIPFLLFFGFSSVRLPWLFGDNYGILQWILWASLTITILLTFGALLGMAFNHETVWKD